MQVQETNTVVRTEHTMAAPIADEIVIMSLNTNNYITLNSIGKRIWELVETPTGVEGLCTQLKAEFKGPPDEIERDVLEFLTQLHSEGVLTITA